MKKGLFHIILGLVLVLFGAAAGSRAYAQKVLTLDPNKALSQYHIDTWTIEDGLPQGSVESISQTHDGYLWVGTQEGLVRFDGIDFTVFTKRDGHLPSGNIPALMPGKDGSLWIATRGGGLTRYKDGQFTTYTEKNGLNESEVSSLLVDDDGSVWVGTYRQGLNRLDPAHFDEYTTDLFTDLTSEDGLPNNEIQTLAKTKDGALWMGTRSTGVIRYKDGIFTTFTTTEGLIHDEIVTMRSTWDGAVWVGTKGGLSRVMVGPDGAANIRNYTTKDGLGDNMVHAFAEDAAGTIWVGTDGGGLCRLEGERFACISSDDGGGLAHNTVISLYADTEGSLWVGTDGGGLNRLKDVKFTHYTTQEGLAHDYVYSIYETPDSAMWIGTEHAGVSRFKDGVFTTFTTADGLIHDEVFSVESTSDGTLWFGTRGGLSRYKDGKFTNFTSKDGLPQDDVWGLFVDSKDNLWLAMIGGLVLFQGGEFIVYTTEHGLASDEVTSVGEGPDGDIWVGTYAHGLHRFRDGQVVEHYDIEGGNNWVINIYTDYEDDALWFSVQESGLLRFKDGELTSFTTEDGLIDDTVTMILEDDRGIFWLAGSVGMWSIPKADLVAYAEGRLERLSPTSYDKADGLKTIEFMGGTQPAGWKSRDGRLWFPSVGYGVAVIDPNDARANAIPPSVVIEAATANDEQIPIGHTVTVLPPGRNRFAFNYVGLNLLAPKQVRYQYMLEGTDEVWVDAGARREAYYTNLEPGVHILRVKARNSEGVWSKEAAVGFYLKPYFYQTTWFYVLCAVSLLLLAFLLYRLRIRSLKHRERELVGLVEARTADLRQEKERTEEALAETEKAWREAERQKEIAEDAKAVIEEQAEKLQEMDRIKTRFFNNISHEFRTPLTLNIGPLENALLGVYGPVSDDMRRQLEVMLRNSRLLLRLINQLLDVAKLESGKMALRVRHGNLVELIEGVLLSFTAFAEKKEVNLKFLAENADLSLNFDPGHLEKVFFNLFSNAVKFTPENGQISVSINDGAPGANGVEGETVIIRIKDSGEGIPEEALPYIFDRFHQVDGTISQVQEGTGIGLSLVKELVELHGGTIQCESQIGVGTEFIVTLPKDTRHLDDTHAQEFDEFEALEAAEEAEKEAQSISHSPMVEMAVFDNEFLAPSSDNAPLLPPDAPTVLVVDDNPEIRDYVAGCLKQSYHLVKAVDGQDALEKARAIRPDLVISDVMMPNLDGYGLCRAIKSDEKLSHIPMILLTSRASLDEKIKGLEAGSDDYLTKPFSARELLVRARNLLHLGLQKKELKALNNALKNANEGLREASQMKSQLLRIAAHDLKNPLNGIREFAKILKNEIDAQAPGQEMLDLIHTSSDQMLDMVGKLLDSEALESGELTLHMEPVSLGKVAEEVVRRNRPQAQRKGEKLILHLDENDPCVVEGSWEWLRDAMDNLVSNAIKYSPLGKTIWVSVKRHGPVVQFTVRDEGPGLTRDDKKKLFGKFQRLSAVPTSNESSTGLGLSIVKQIVEMHNGQVWAKSEPGQGSTFVIELPVSEDAHPEPGEATPPATRDRIPPSHDRWSSTSSDSFPAESE